ncbi:leucine-rich repeat-containing protein 24-like [Branchiostoma floridae]|uniref:Leucine-rich repeat-containing protein 24-like n=1 Tax=Branchiostoma floridae TaxID=7739 RepID=A0A9J7HMF1_BRAFL|nr:leucine-rich repeat-containing protein 24-like [Branchiostoma floridae]
MKMAPPTIYVITYVIIAVLVSEAVMRTEALRACGRWLVCDCDPTVNAVHCNMFNLNVMPAGIPASTIILDLSNNRIPTTANQFANFYRLRYLDFSSNGLQTIAGGTFNNLNQLELLDLSDNLFVNIPCGILSLFPKLRIFKFSGNPVSSFPGNCFMGMKAIQQLDLSRMKLATVSEDAFQWVPTLNQLDISRNQLQTLSAGFCPNGGNLIETMQLYGNPWLCDCNLQQIQRCTNITRNIRCAVPRMLRGLAADILLQFAPDRLVCPAAPMSINLSSSDVTAYVGDSLSITCNSPGVRSDKITWLKMTGDVRRAPTRSVQSGPILPFARVQLVDGGTYICEADSNAWAVLTLRVLRPLPTTTTLPMMTTLPNTTAQSGTTTGLPPAVATTVTTTVLTTTGNLFSLSGLAVQSGGDKPFDWTLLIIAVSAAAFTVVVVGVVSAVVYCIWKRSRWKRRLKTYEGPSPMSELAAFDHLFTGHDSGSQNSTPSSGYDSSPLNPDSARSRPSSPAVRQQTPPAVPYVNRHKRRPSKAGDAAATQDASGDVPDAPTSPRSNDRPTSPVSPRSIRGLAYRPNSAGSTGSNRRTGTGNTKTLRRTARRDKGTRPARKEGESIPLRTRGSKASLGLTGGDEEHYV